MQINLQIHATLMLQLLDLNVIHGCWKQAVVARLAEEQLRVDVAF